MGEYTTDVYNITNLTLNIRKRSASLNESVMYLHLYVVFSISDENISRLNKFKNRRYAPIIVIHNVNGCTVCTVHSILV